MGLLSKIFSKKSKEVTQSVSKQEEDFKKTVDELLECLKEHTEVPVVRFALKKEIPDILDSKIGGAFYVPENMEIPKNKATGKQLYLLTQLNFAQIPHLEDFPKSGLLQIFIAGDDDIYGCEFGDSYEQNGWRMRYIAELPTEVPKECICDTEWEEETVLPFEKNSLYKLEAKMDKQVISCGDYRFDGCLQKYCREIVGEEVTSAGEMDEDVREALEEKLETFSCQMGGYPFFTQYDPRENMENEEEAEILLFQLDTVEDIMWGDAGVANFFISRKNLRNREFGKVLYNWDCY